MKKHPHGNSDKSLGRTKDRRHEQQPLQQGHVPSALYQDKEALSSKTQFFQNSVRDTHAEGVLFGMELGSVT
jgi:hypothetical protein